MDLKMKNKIFWNLIILLLILPFEDVLPQSSGTESYITTAVPFLTITPDSRAGAMGDVGVATTPDCFSLHWNAAKYAFIDGKTGVALAYTPWLRAIVPDMNIAYLTGYYRLDSKQTIAASLMYNSLGELDFRDDFGQVTINSFKANEFAIDGSYSRLFSDHFSGGIALRFIYSNLTGGMIATGTETKPGISFAADLSGYYTRDIELSGKTGQIRAGINFSNIGSKLSYTDARDPDFIPMNMRLGTSGTLNLDSYNSITLSLDLNKLLVPTPPKYDISKKDSIISGKNPHVGVPVAIFQSFHDAPGGLKEELHEITYSFGAEYWYNKQFALRCGYFYEDASKGNRKNFTAGAGVRMNIFTLDFSYLMALAQNSPLARTIRFTLSFDFNSLRNVSKSRG